MHAILQRLTEILAFEKKEPSGTIECTERTLGLIRALREPPDSASTPTHVTKFDPAAPCRTTPARKLVENTTPATATEEPVSDRDTAMDAIAARVCACVQCPLHQTRTQAVPGQGTSCPDIAFIGEAPGADEDRQGLAFVGRAGQLLTKMIQAIGYAREDVFIGNILKCRPPNNRAPSSNEMAVCFPYLREQLAILRPKIIVSLGATAFQGLLPNYPFSTMGKVRGQWQNYDGIPVMPTFHPAYLLRQPSEKRKAWQDLQEALKRLGRTGPPVQTQP